MFKTQLSSALSRLLCFVAFALCFGGVANAQTITVTPPTLNERVEGNVQTFVLTTDRIVTQRLTVRVDSFEGTAFEAPRPDGRPADYTGFHQDVTFEIGRQSVSVPIQTIADTRYEFDETFGIQVTNPRFNGTPTNTVTFSGSNFSTTTIPNDDDPPTLTLRRPDAVIEGAATDPRKLVRVLVDINVPAERPLQVAFDTSDNSTQPGSMAGTATAGQDYQEVRNNIVTIPANAQQYTYPPLPGPTDPPNTFSSDPNAQGVFIIGDNIYEGDEAFTLTARFSPALVNTTPTSTIITITDDDLPSFTLTGGRTFEGGSIPFVITLNDITTGQPIAARAPITFNYVLDNGPNNQAGFGTDFTNTPGPDANRNTGTFVIPIGNTNATINIPTLTDTIAEPTEQFSFRIVNVTGARLSPNSSATGTIDNVNGNPVISIANASVIEGTNGVTNMVFTVSLSNSSTQQITVDYETLDDNTVPADQRATSGVDYAARRGTVTFPAVTGAAGDANTTQTISIPITTDNINEKNENFRVRLFNPAGGFASFPNNAPEIFATGTIIDDDSAGTVSMAKGETSVLENVTGGKVNITVNLLPNGTPARPVTVDFTTLPGTASQTGQRDYFGKTGRVTFQPAAGNASVDIPIDIINDDIREGDETFTVRLTAVDGATLDPNNTDTVVTIIDDDPLPVVSVFPASPIREDGGVKNFVVAIKGKSQTPVTVNYAFGDTKDTATQGADYEAVDSLNPLSGSKTFTLGGPVSYFVPVRILQDNIAEGNETLTLALSKDQNDVSFTLDPQASKSVVTIVDDDSTPELTIKDAQVLEGSTGDINSGNALTFDVSLSRPSSRPSSFTYSTLNLRQSNCKPSNGCDVASDDDYASVRNVVVTIPAGETTATITIKVAPDTGNEYNEQFAVIARALVNTVPSVTPAKAEVEQRFGTVAYGTILNDDPGGVITIAGPFTDATGTTLSGNLIEGYKRNATATSVGSVGNFRVTLPTPAHRTVTVTYKISGSVTLTDSDINDITTGPGRTGDRTGAVTFFAGDTTRNIALRAAADNEKEDLESLRVTISITDVNGANNYTVAPNAASAQTSIVDRTPSIDAFTPTNGFPSYGNVAASKVTINGRLLRTDGNPRVNSVVFGGGGEVGLGGIQYTSDNSIVVSVPDNAKSGPLTLVLTDGSTRLVFPTPVGGTVPIFTVRPVIQSFTPVTGTRAATTLTITGRNFLDGLNPVTGVQFSNGVVVSNVKPDSDTQITVLVPATAATGPLNIVTKQGAGPASQTNFTVVNATAGSLRFGANPDTSAILEGSTGNINQPVRNFNGTGTTTYHGVYQVFINPATQTSGPNAGQPLTPQTPITVRLSVTASANSTAAGAHTPQIAVRGDLNGSGRATFLKSSTEGIVDVRLPATYNPASPLEVAIVDAGNDDLAPIEGGTAPTVTVTASISASDSPGLFPITPAGQAPSVIVERRKVVTNTNQTIIVFGAGTNTDFSLPYATNANGTVAQTEVFDSAPTNTGGTVRFYQVYRFDAANQLNNRTTAGDFIPVGNGERLQRGVGYRLVVGDRDVRLNAKGASLQVISAGSFAINLTRNVPLAANSSATANATNGYNYIGFPFDNTRFGGVNLNNSTVTVDGATRSFSDAVAAGLINSQLYTVDAQGVLTAVTGDPILRPFKAYFVQIYRNNLTLTLNNPSP